tara:strand:- start:364 stop:537 length:174 start_codon:yes stop_codon:yes gene_type:complete
MKSELDVNILVKHYHKRLSELTNQNILLEAKLDSLSQEYFDLQKVVQDLQAQEENDD